MGKRFCVSVCEVKILSHVVQCFLVISFFNDFNDANNYCFKPGIDRSLELLKL